MLRIENFSRGKHSHLLDELTALLHEAYRSLAESGLQYNASHQDAAKTQRRLEKGWGFLGFLGEELVGTITLIKDDPVDPAPYYLDPEIYHFSQFAVRIDLQRQGLGKKLLEHVEGFACEQGARELALDTAEQATELQGYYQRLGYRHVGYADYESTNYRSVVLSKVL